MGGAELPCLQSRSVEKTNGLSVIIWARLTNKIRFTCLDVSMWSGIATFFPNATCVGRDSELEEWEGTSLATPTPDIDLDFVQFSGLTICH